MTHVSSGSLQHAEAGYSIPSWYLVLPLCLFGLPPLALAVSPVSTPLSLNRFDMVCLYLKNEAHILLESHRCVLLFLCLCIPRVWHHDRKRVGTLLCPRGAAEAIRRQVRRVCDRTCPRIELEDGWQVPFQCKDVDLATPPPERVERLPHLGVHLKRLPGTEPHHCARSFLVVPLERSDLRVEPFDHAAWLAPPVIVSVLVHHHAWVANARKPFLVEAIMMPPSESAWQPMDMRFGRRFDLRGRFMCVYF
jgi:hypothetical protein